MAALFKSYPHGEQNKIAGNMGIEPGDLSGYLGGKRNWSEDKCIWLAEIVGTTYMDVLLNWDVNNQKDDLIIHLKKDHEKLWKAIDGINEKLKTVREAPEEDQDESSVESKKKHV